jgi:hypothetical protein
MLAGALVYKSKNVEHAYLKFFKCINSFSFLFSVLAGFFSLHYGPGTSLAVFLRLEIEPVSVQSNQAR